jgi:2',3'-cyclic-nucleotide 2'-phosphodiesterase (5'-nucleotidase family)
VGQQHLKSKHLLLLDTGDALVGGGLLGDATRGDAVVAGMNLMGYDAMALGPNELGLGAETLNERLESAQFPMLSANVVISGMTELYARPYALLDVGGHRLGIVGLTRPTGEPIAGFQVLDPQEAASRFVPEVGERAETVIVLTNLSHGAAKALAKEVPGIDLLIAALPRQLPRQAVTVPGTDTVSVSAEQAMARHSGRRVGRLLVTVGADGLQNVESWHSVPMARDLPDDVQMRELLLGYRQ